MPLIDDIGLFSSPTTKPIAEESLTTGQKIVRQAAPSTIGGAIGGGVGSFLAPGPGTLLGAMIGSGLGEAALQFVPAMREFAGVESGPTEAGIQTGIATLSPLAAPLITKGLKHLPGASVALRQAGQETVERIPKSILPKVPSSVFFDRLEELNPTVQLPRLKGMADKLVKLEAELGEFGLENRPIAGVAGKTGKGLVETTVEKPVGKFIGDEFEQEIRTAKELKDIPFRLVQNIRRRLGQRIHSLRFSTDPKAEEARAAYKQMFRELSEDLEHASEKGAGGAFKLLKQANEAAKREFASEQLDDIFFESIGKAKEGAELTSSNFAQAFNKLRKLRREDDLFIKSFRPGELDQIQKTLKELSEIKLPPPPKGLNVGSMLTLTNRVGLAGSAGFISSQLGLDPTATIGGTLATQWILGKAISSAVQSQIGRNTLLNIMRSPGGLSPAKINALLSFTKVAGSETVR